MMKEVLEEVGIQDVGLRRGAPPPSPAVVEVRMKMTAVINITTNRYTHEKSV